MYGYPFTTPFWRRLRSWHRQWCRLPGRWRYCVLAFLVGLRSRHPCNPTVSAKVP